MLSWSDQNSWVCALLAGLAVLGPSVLVLRRVWALPDTSRSIGVDWWGGLTVIAVLVIRRWPSLLDPRQFNTDEGLQIAGALTLRHDLNFWRSVFGTTTGPLDFYALLPVGNLLGTDNFCSARLTGLLLMAGALIFIHQAIATNFGTTIARISTFPVLCFEAFSRHPDFLHYSTELLPICLLSGAFYFGDFIGIGERTRSPWRAVVTGVLLGAVPFAKLQAAPIAAVGGVALCLAHLRSGSLAPRAKVATALTLVAGAALPLLVFSIMLAQTGDRVGAWTSFIPANVAYVENGFASVKATLLELSTRLQANATLYLPWLGGIGLASSVLVYWVRVSNRRARRLGAWAIGWLVISVLCIATPRRPFLHYLQLSVVPITLVFAALLASTQEQLARTRTSVQRLVLAATFMLPLSVMVLAGALAPDPAVEKLHLYQQFPRGEAAVAILKYGSPGEALGLWGWNARYYVETGMRQATRHAMSDLLILINPYVDFFRERYLNDLRRTMPPVFIDASWVSHHYENREMGHDISFPAVGELIAAHYALAQTVDEVRIYVRRDRFEQRGERRTP